MKFFKNVDGIKAHMEKQADLIRPKFELVEKIFSDELASRGITVNAVAPGFIETEMTEVLSDKLKEEMRGQIPLARMGQPEDVAKAVAFLASEHASYITGQVLQIDGGMVM